MKGLKGVKTFIGESIDYTSTHEKRRAGTSSKREFENLTYLFPPLDLPSGHKKSSAFIEQPQMDGFISLGVSVGNKSQTTPYRKVRDFAVCLAIFGPGGEMVANTNNLIEGLQKR